MLTHIIKFSFLHFILSQRQHHLERGKSSSLEHQGIGESTYTKTTSFTSRLWLPLTYALENAKIKNTAAGFVTVELLASDRAISVLHMLLFTQPCTRKGSGWRARSVFFS